MEISQPVFQGFQLLANYQKAALQADSDKASVRNAEVPAANSGRVIFSGELGIYGNIVVVDHGLGLMSLYSHLNDSTVRAGDVVQKGQLLGHTGTTGLA